MLLEPDTLAKCKTLLQSVPDTIRYAVGGVNLRNDSGKTVVTMPGEVEGVEAHLPKGHALFWQNGLFHHRSLFAVNRFDTSLKIFGDYDFICRTWSDETAVHIPFTISAITLGGISNSPRSLLNARLEALRISQRYYSARYLPKLCLDVAKSSLAYSMHTLLGPHLSIKALNRIRKARGLPPTWVEHAPSAEKGTATRRLQAGYLYHNKICIMVLKLVDGLLRLFPLKKKKFPDKVCSILLIKPDHLGDVLLMGSIIPLLKTRFPNSSLDLVVGSWSKLVVKSLPGIREFFVVDHWMLNRNAFPLWKKLFVFIISFTRSLVTIRKRHYDLCLCLRSFGGNLISLGALSGARFLAGHGTGGLGPLLDAQVAWHPGLHETAHFLEVLSACGISDVGGDLCYPVLTGADRGRLEKQKEELGIGEHYTVISPCSGHGSKMFPVGYWRRMIQESPQMLFVISVGPEEKREAEAIASGLPNTVVGAGIFALPDLVVLLGEAEHIHTVDSFGAHLAGSSGAPTTVHCRKSGADMVQFRPLENNVLCIYPEIDEKEFV